MTKLARTTPRPAPTRPVPRAAQPRTKLVVVRRPVRSAHDAHGDRTSVRVGVGVVVTLGVIGAIWLLGYLGFYLGFAGMLGVPELTGTMGQGLISGALMVITMPQVIIKAGVAQPMWLMLLFVMMALPAGGLSAARPLARGGPAPPPLVKVMSGIACGLAGINSLVLVWWIASPFRQSMLGMLPADPAQGTAWFTDIQTIAGFDVLACTTAALWVVLMFRLTIPLWLRGLSASVTLFALGVMAIGMASSTATAAQLSASRSVCVLAQDAPRADDPAHQRILLGLTPHGTVTMRIVNETVVVEMLDPTDRFTVVGRRSIAESLEAHAPD